MSNEINAVIPAANLTANLSTGPQLSGNLTPTQMSAELTPGNIIMNDYRLTVSDIEGGKRLTVKRGAEVQEMDIMDGTDGISPHIGENGNWWIGEVDTGVAAGGTGGSGGGSADIGNLEEAIREAVDSRFFVVTYEATDGEYHGDLTFAEIREKFEAGGNLVARIDGTDYIPLLSAAPHQIIFSGIYQAQSVALTVNSKDVCTLTTTSLANRQHTHSVATSSANGFMKASDKVKLDGIDTSLYELKKDAQLKYDGLKSEIDSLSTIVGITDITISEVV